MICFSQKYNPIVIPYMPVYQPNKVVKLFLNFTYMLSKLKESL